MEPRILNLSMFVLLVALVAGRGLILRRRGINAFLFGATDKSDFLLLPVLVFGVYTLLSGALGLPLPGILGRRLVELRGGDWAGVALCAAGLLMLAAALWAFGTSFRVGIDKTAPDRLITGGVFAVSRNPIYLAFLSFAAGTALIHRNPAALLAPCCLAVAIHRQILREEAFLRAHYTDEYLAYCRKVRRYL